MGDIPESATEFHIDACACSFSPKNSGFSSETFIVQVLFYEFLCPLEPGFDGIRWLFTFSKKITMTLTIPLMTRPHKQTTRDENKEFKQWLNF